MPDTLTPRKTIGTVLGAVRVMPECKAQAVCTNGSKCWEAGSCLRASAASEQKEGPSDARR